MTTNTTPRKAPAKAGAARKPRDRQPKKLTKAQIEERHEQGFTFTGPDGTEHTLAPMNTLDAGFYRANRRRSSEDALFSMLEELADEDALAAIDAMKKAEFVEFQNDLNEFHGVTVGDT